jgi:hypothetical protein
MEITGLDDDGRFDPKQGGYITVSEAIEMAGRHAKMAHNTGAEQTDDGADLAEDSETTDDELTTFMSAMRDAVLTDVAISRAFSDLARVKIEEEQLMAVRSLLSSMNSLAVRVVALGKRAGAATKDDEDEAVG